MEDVPTCNRGWFGVQFEKHFNSMLHMHTYNNYSALQWVKLTNWPAHFSSVCGGHGYDAEYTIQLHPSK